MSRDFGSASCGREAAVGPIGIRGFSYVIEPSRHDLPRSAPTTNRFMTTSVTTDLMSE